VTYRYRNLSHTLEDPASPLRAYFHERFPHMRSVQDGYRRASGPIAVDGVAASPGTVGAAFDFLLRFCLDAGYRPGIAAAAVQISAVADHVATVHDVAAVAGAAARRLPDGDALTTAVRACWALALTTELYRNPLLVMGSAPAELIDRGEFTTEALLALAPDDAVEVVSALYTGAAAELTGVLAASHDRVALGATFAASRVCPADADMIVDGTLIESKTRLGNKNKRSGVRSDSLPRNDIYQLLGYVLFDDEDRYGVTEVALYSARYATLHRWAVQELLDTLAGEPVDLAAERATVRKLLDVDGHEADIGPEPAAADIPPDAASPQENSPAAAALLPDSSTVLETAHTESSPEASLSESSPAPEPSLADGSAAPEVSLSDGSPAAEAPFADGSAVTADPSADSAAAESAAQTGGRGRGKVSQWGARVVRATQQVLGRRRSADS
jgi:hypothetical protein